MPGLLTFLLAVAALTPMPAGTRRPALTVALQVHDDVRVDPAILRDAAARVRDIWRPYADVTVVVPGTTGTGPGEQLTLVVTNRTLAQRRESLGWITFVNGRPQPVGYVSIAAVRAILRASTWNGLPARQWPLATWRLLLTPALSRAVAHEVGHYLLASPAHTRGLMQASFTADVLTQPRSVHDRLDPADVDRLRSRPLVAGLPPSTAWTGSDPAL
jgi:hypothetical protein